MMDAAHLVVSPFRFYNTHNRNCLTIAKILKTSTTTTTSSSSSAAGVIRAAGFKETRKREEEEEALNSSRSRSIRRRRRRRSSSSLLLQGRLASWRRSSVGMAAAAAAAANASSSSSSIQAHNEVEEEDDNCKPTTTVLIKIHYHRKKSDYENWGLHVWGDAAKASTLWDAPLAPAGFDAFGVFWEVETINMQQNGDLHFQIHQGDVKDCAGLVPSGSSTDVWVVSEKPTVFLEEPDLTSLPQGDLGSARAYWVEEDLLAWISDVKDAQFHLHASANASLKITSKGIEGADFSVKLEEDLHGLPPRVVKKFPHIHKYRALCLLPCGDGGAGGYDVKKYIKCQLALSSTDATTGAPLDASGVQLPGVLDALFAYNGPLGAHVSDDAVTLTLWAPTAQNVRVLLYSLPMGGSDKAEDVVQLHEENGVWMVRGPNTWKGKYYLYEVTVFHPLTQQIEKTLASDPYSRSLAANGERSLVIDLVDTALMPEGWETLAQQKPRLKAFTDIAIYELHIRDFSISDPTVDPAVQGGYLAFSEKESAGVMHLKNLADAGLTHVHLLPCFDFATVNEQKETWKTVDTAKLASYAPDSEEQQAAVVAIQDEDGFNWGYDPVHWGVPEGSYATDPNGPTRTTEFRTMVQALNRIGLRVVLDVVYNHIHGSGPSGIHSCLDKVVPGYYLRLDKDGAIENSTCMNNTASEHYMVDRLIVDDLKSWAVNYKVDGFRFDLMGHLMLQTMLHAKEVLRSLTIEKDGVDGSKIYLYGEGWDFGEVSKNSRGLNASQHNLAGTGIGSFNDRIRDTAIGGSPFGDPLQQGFLTGLSLQPNALFQGGQEATRHALASTTDWVRLGLAANLKDYVFTSHTGHEIKGGEVLTHDNAPVAYASSPEELVNYVSAHDNESLFDIIMLKCAPEVSLEERCRINHVATSIVALAQGIPFFHAGDDMLRSKSLDRDSYNSGDWFNRLDFSYETNNWAVGLPPKNKNGFKWSIMRELLGDPSLKPTKTHILAAVENFKELLRIRFSSPLFRLTTANAIQGL
ncbi:hypothetical protein CY35_05G052200 [Sphagnum magellanicum]|nr:hypothetical protein CY35_05G052200 [Sphagnum magellanicum]